MEETLKKHGKIPKGPSQPIDLNMTPESFKSIEKLVAEFGAICKVQAISRKSDSYIINHPDYVKRVLLQNHQNYLKGVGFDRVKMLLGNGIIVSDGAFWRRQRRMMQPSFNRKVTAQLSVQIKKCNLDLFKKWQVLAENEEVIDLSKVSSELALEIVLRAMLSNDLDQIIARYDSNPFSILTEDPARDMQLVLKFRELGKILLELIQQRRDEQPERYDFLAMFMDSRDKETDEAMTDKELLDELMTMIVAGHETSAISLSWFWYFLAKYPAIEKQVQTEVDKAGFTTVPDFEELDQLPYVKQVLDEAMRYYPPVWLFTRKAIEDDQLGEYHIPAGSDIFISPYYLHRNENYWPDAEEFNPDRFTAEKVQQQHKQAYIPFSVGPRRCIGDFFATVEMQMHIGLMAKQFVLEDVSDQAVELSPEINLRNKHQFMMKIKNR